ncbi:hypothetical protein PFISCL1PPCAC_18217, partial [Pristionchus fissidentatus]
QATKRTSSRELRIINMLLDTKFLSEMSQALNGKTTHTVHFLRVRCTDLDKDKKTLVSHIHTLHPQALIFTDGKPKDCDIFNEEFIETFVCSGWDYYSLRVEPDHDSSW